MKKMAIVMISVVAALVICAAALANNTAVELYDSATELLFGTDNATLKAHAEFSLDGSRFKTVDCELKQDGHRSFRQLLLSSPKADGTERKNGYTIVTENNAFNLMEVFTPGIYSTGYVADRTSILRSTVETKQLAGLGRALASQADLFLGAGAVTKAEDGSFRVTVGEDVPDMTNNVLNQIVRFAAKRYFAIDQDVIRTNSTVSLNSFLTVSQGILHTMQGVSLRKADVILKADENGSLLQAEGTVGLRLETACDGIRQLDVTFRIDVADRGNTLVKAFNPEDYKVVPVPVEEAAYGFALPEPEVVSLINEEP